MEISIVVIIVGILGLLWAMVSVAKKAEGEEADQKIKLKLDQKYRQVKSYFFTDEKFDFDKFCDYILCIRDDEDFKTYLGYMSDLEVLLGCSEGLKERFTDILFTVPSITALVGDSAAFDELQICIRERQFEGTQGDFCLMFFMTVFYLKRKMNETRPK